MALVRDFPLFPLGLVALPSELVPLHIFEERYKSMMARVLEEEGEFGIVWVADDGLRPVGCACEIAEVLERMPDGRLNLVARGTRAFRIEARQEELEYPAGTVEFLDDRDEELDVAAAEEAHTVYAELVAEATDRTPDPAETTSTAMPVALVKAAATILFTVSSLAEYSTTRCSAEAGRAANKPRLRARARRPSVRMRMGLPLF